MRLPRKRWWLLAGAILAVGIVAYLLTRPEPLEDRVARIQLGMTREDVERELEVPPGVYYDFGFTERIDPSTEGPEWSHWRWDEGHVGVRFDSGGHADQILFDPHPPVSAYDHLRWRLELWRWRLTSW